MNSVGASLLKLMFNPGEFISVSDSQYANHSVDLEEVMGGQTIQLISANETVPPKTVSTDSLIFVALNPIHGVRNDANCYKYRNILVEIDKSDRKTQLAYLKKIGIPVSAIVWSGSKSTHTLISVAEDFPDEKTYRLVYKWILNIVGWADQVLGNPSRSIRIPGAIRPETGKPQELIELKQRITHKELFAWLNLYPHLMPKPVEKRIVVPGEADFSMLSIWARIQLTKGIDYADRGRNQTFFGLAYDMALAGFSEDQATNLLLERFTEERDFKEKELLRTIRSAFETVDKTALKASKS